MAHQLPTCAQASTCPQAAQASTCAKPAQPGATVSGASASGSTVLLILNGTTKPATFNAERYKELWPAGQQGTITAREVTSGRTYDITKDFTLSPRQTLLLEY